MLRHNRVMSRKTDSVLFTLNIKDSFYFLKIKKQLKAKLKFYYFTDRDKGGALGLMLLNLRLITLPEKATGSSEKCPIIKGML
jgi:hypothetical protein